LGYFVKAYSYYYDQIITIKNSNMKVLKISTVLFLFLVISCNSNQDSSSNKKQINSQTMEIIKDQGVITKVSSQNFEETYNVLVHIITNNPNLKIIAELNHQANAARVDLQLNPTRIIMFGNPNLGTPLMQNSPVTGLDLPQKILIWQDDQGQVKVSYNDPLYLKNRHGIEGKDEILQKISSALDMLTNKAIGEL